VSDDRIELWNMAALALGYNELAKQQTTLGQKTFCRLLRDKADKKCQELGASLVITADETILTLHDCVPEIKFRATDIELMRACVAAHDANASAKGNPS
jgi:hypothetical protein